MLAPNLFQAASNRQNPTLTQQTNYDVLLVLKQALVQKLTETYLLKYDRIKWKLLIVIILLHAIGITTIELTGNDKQNKLDKFYWITSLLFVSFSLGIINICIDGYPASCKTINTDSSLLAPYQPCENILLGRLRVKQPSATTQTLKDLALNKIELLVNACIQDPDEYKSQSCLSQCTISPHY